MISTRNKLYKDLQRKPTAPDYGFEHFIVGKPETMRNVFNTLTKNILDCSEPSQVRFILGANGNGKTLLNKMIMYDAAEKNIALTVDRHIQSTEFEILFSRITLNESDPNRMGIDFAKSLKRSIKEPSNVTYLSIASRIFKNFAESYKPTFGINITSLLVKWPLKKAIRLYEENLEGIFTTDEVDPVVKLLDEAFTRVQKKMINQRVRKAFRKYADSQQIHFFLRNYILNESEPLSSTQLNNALFNDLTTKEGIAHPSDTVKALAEIAKDVSCKLLILIIDDFNAYNPPKSLLPLLDSLDDFRNPKLLLVVNGVEEVWMDYRSRKPKDKAYLQKLETYGNVISLKPPTEDDISKLLDKLISLMTLESKDEDKIVKISQNQKEDLKNNCPMTSFREAMKYLIDELEKCIALIELSTGV